MLQDRPHRDCMPPQKPGGWRRRRSENTIWTLDAQSIHGQHQEARILHPRILETADDGCPRKWWQKYNPPSNRGLLERHPSLDYTPKLQPCRCHQILVPLYPTKKISKGTFLLNTWPTIPQPLRFIAPLTTQTHHLRTYHKMYLGSQKQIWANLLCWPQLR